MHHSGGFVFIAEHRPGRIREKIEVDGHHAVFDVRGESADPVIVVLAELVLVAVVFVVLRVLVRVVKSLRLM